jgi:hypothetical protein
MPLTRRHPSSRLAPIFLAAVSALVGAILVANDVRAGASNKTVVRDPASDIEPGCDIRRATSKLTDAGRLRHTITLQQATGVLSVHRVTIYGGRRGGADLSLSDETDGVDARLANQGRSVVFTVGRGRVAQAVDSQRRYFWVARSCTNPGDRAPNNGRARQPL